jgi:hypothetical protein
MFFKSVCLSIRGHCDSLRLHNRVISIRGEVWADKTSFTPPLFFIEVPVPNFESE